MITKENVFKIGRLQKSHGIKGEISILYYQDSFGDIDVDYYFMDLDSIFVPFRIEEINFMSDTRGRVKFEDIDDENTAAKYSNIDIYILKDEMPEIQEYPDSEWDLLVGYDVIDQNQNNLGTIEHVDYSTINTLFVVRKNNEEHLIPATEDFITQIDQDNKTIHLNLPEGLIEQ